VTEPIYVDADFWVARAAEKQASRDADELALESGEKTRDQLRRENGHFSSLRFRVNPAGARRLA
jgi:hypothetical protein